MFQKLIDSISDIPCGLKNSDYFVYEHCKKRLKSDL